MPISSRYKKAIKVSLTSLFVFGVILASVASYLNYKWEPILAVTLKESIAKSTAGLYKLEFKEIHLNLLSGKFRIKDLHIIPDMEKYHQLKKLNNTPAYLYTIQLKEFTISNYNPFDLYFNQTLDIYSVTMYEPEIEVINFVNKPKQAGDSIYRSPYDLIKNILKGVYINHIHLINSKVSYISDYDSLRKSQDIFFSGINIKNLTIDSLSEVDSSRLFYSDNIHFSIRNFQIPMRDSLYILSFEEANANTGNSTIQFYNLKYTPRYDEENFMSDEGYRKSRFEVSFKEAVLKGFDFKKIFFEQKILADNLLIKKANANIHTNKRIPYDKEFEHRFLMESLEDIKIPFTFNHVQVEKSGLSYSEYDEKIDYRWDISFGNVTIKATNLTNDKIVKQKNALTKINAYGNFNNLTSFNLNLRFFHGMNLGEFSCNGSFGEMNANKLNPIIIPFTKIEVANCAIKKIFFTMRGDRRAMRVNMTMPYENLRVVVLEMDSNEQRLKRQGLISMLANLIVVKKDNPRNNTDLYSPSFILNRKFEQSFFSFLWKGLFRGIKESIGLTVEMENEIRNRIALQKESKARKEKMLEQKAENKEIRIQKRKERKIKRNSKLLDKTKENISTKAEINPQQI